jgi:hypothetical protein
MHKIYNIQGRICRKYDMKYAEYERKYDRKYVNVISCMKNSAGSIFCIFVIIGHIYALPHFADVQEAVADLDLWEEGDWQAQRRLSDLYSVQGCVPRAPQHI